MTAYTLNTRTVRTVRGLGASAVVTERQVQTIHLDGAYFGDVPEGRDAAEVLATLNDAADKADAYRAQFTDSEWARQEDEAAGG